MYQIKNLKCAWVYLLFFKKTKNAANSFETSFLKLISNRVFGKTI